MRKFHLFNQTQISEQLRLFCQKKPRICAKQNASGWGSNKRILVVSDNKLQYYKYSSQFIENDYLSLKQKHLKSYVFLQQIDEISFLPEDSSCKKILEVKIQAKKVHKIKKQQSKTQPNSMMGKANITDKLLQQPQHLMQAVNSIEPSSEIPQQISDIAQDSKNQNWKFYFTYDVKGQIDQIKKQIYNNKKEQIQIETEVMLQKSDDKEVMDKQLREQMLEGTKNNTKVKDIKAFMSSIQNAKQSVMQKQTKQNQWRRRQKKSVKVQQNENFDQQREISFHVDFWRRYYKSYDDLQKSKLNGNTIIHKQLTLLQQIQSFQQSAIRIVQSYINDKIIGIVSSTKKFQDFCLYQGIWIKTGGKQLNQQYLQNYWLSDIIYNMDPQQKYKFRLPLMCFIEYKTIKVLCMCDMPFSEIDKSQVYNLIASESYDILLMVKIKEYLQQFEILLNVKNQPLMMNNNKIIAPLGHRVRVFQYNAKNDFKVDNQPITNFYYLMNVKNLFPMDPLTIVQHKSTYYKLRPELISSEYQQYKAKTPQMLSQAFMVSHSMDDNSKKREDQKVLQRAHLINSLCIPLLVEYLDSGKLIILDSYSLKEAFSELGINIRYMHELVNRCLLPYVIQMVTAEAIARTVKRLYRQYMQNIITQSMQDKKTTQWRSIEDQINQSNTQLVSYAIDFLNLIFGDTDESVKYWDIIISNCYRNYKIKVHYPPNIRPGCLLLAVLWNCSFVVNFKPNVQLFKSTEPFNKQNWVQFQTKCKIFDFPSLKINKIIRNNLENEDYASDTSIDDINFRLLKLEHLFNHTLYKDNFRQQITLAKMNTIKKNIEMPTPKINLHPCLISHLITNKSQLNFKKALEIMDFCLPDSHPLYISLYEEYSNFFEKQLFIKTTIMLSVKCFGQFHNLTTKLYSKYNKMGYKQYQTQALRDSTIQTIYNSNTNMFQDKQFLGCLRITEIYINKYKTKQLIITSLDVQAHIAILRNGLQAGIEVLQLDRALKIAQQFSKSFNQLEFNDIITHFYLFRSILHIKLLRSPQKNYMYRITILLLRMQRNYEPQRTLLNKEDEQIQCGQQQRHQILKVILNQYQLVRNHESWISFILQQIHLSYKYFYYIDSFEDNFQKYLLQYNNVNFKSCLAAYQLLIRLYGQKFFRQILYEIVPI